MTKQNTHHLSHDELTEHARQLEHENQKLRRAADMLTEISKLVRNAGGSTTLEAVAKLRGRALMQQAYSFLALNALELDAGEWEAGKKIRHLREQIQLAIKHLLKADTNGAELDEFIVLVSDKDGLKHTKLHYLFSEALADYMVHRSSGETLVAKIQNSHQPLQKIRYKGVDLVVSGGDQ
ncbi:hypothetical protein [Neptuniibacter pectenicola]|uniref:hypothetical protein n=1 Tax=Neptuniibacter pectenicola TaxID=1806669 RepID=UPI000836D96B|nr:hypothetical protein [Neptuniibacter pectenicola]